MIPGRGGLPKISAGSGQKFSEFEWAREVELIRDMFLKDQPGYDPLKHDHTISSTSL